MRGRREFSRLYREGRRRQAGPVVVITAPGRPGPPQVGIVAGRRVGTAVARNRAKRRLRAALAGVALAEGTAYVVVAGPDVNEVAFTRLEDWIAAGVKRQEETE